MPRSLSPKFRMEIRKENQRQTLCPLNRFLLSLELLDDSEFETNNVLGEDGGTFISVESSYMHRNLQ